MFNGVGTALLTPFNEDFTIDYTSYEKLLKYQIENEIDYLVVLGTTGEAPVISFDEREKLIAFTQEKVNGKVKIVVGTGSNNPKNVIENNKLAEKYKVDGVLIVNPYYNKSSQKGLVEYYKYICENTQLPVILYNVPGRTGMNVLPETVIAIADQNKNVVAVKEASGNISQIAQLIASKPKDLQVISGNDDQTLPIMALGGVGVISVFSNIFPKEMKILVDAMLNNNFEKAREIHNRYLNMMNLLFVETSPSPAKYLASYMGLMKNILRMPLYPISKKSEEILVAEYNKLKEMK
ncbi:MAG TPA: 4-hydroxy-tetrahydrodipicolinate synthase [Ignavibacteriales bacterium]|nr:4-hydroxy-tetrahydrodipicolinate synthase [Ignavibacteriales bacterium]HOL81037.1 4-hydroxy-tetrahydrodipicolinate synthase [Ignavibacteriales bacterium]HOM64772.1 4-hydroxy-tetrahydrodipicolinate synthase [Ignavibacteriales bacterium]HPD68488.1 4-hydroxy-tetrahydrodipicolinate synthase [Ignavibacteriales bacterium]HPP32817.1 4-hydroxy-tetrahydrodipicolinate synthase [Ignavibacteriales bacterium]